MSEAVRGLRPCSSFYPGARLCAIAATALSVSLAVLTIDGPQRPWLVWNVSASAPTGLYSVGKRDGLTRGDMVIAVLPEPWRRFAARRHYLPQNVPLVKRVAAVPGDRVCASDEGVEIDGQLAAWRLELDAQGRKMPLWAGCRILQRHEYLLLMTESPASFDGRYFGISRASDIIGKARHLWAA